MSDIVIKAENLGKKYVIGHQAERGSYTALRDVLMQNARNLWNKTKDLATGKPIIQGDTMEEVWALKDVSFEIRRGEAVGIIGRNGAGKSTLLKILSRITEPSTGRVTIKGRVASLLEVGTGFHPELTGRENIYLNGTILGMTRVEIKHKFDEIVAFAEIEKFLDTPVKRYSSGMYVRLAFAVAAHLEPEILVVDEVLAVGDASFQKKCLGKMGDVAKEGRTVLFVSHNMGAIRNLCTLAIWLESGKVVTCAESLLVINSYLKSTFSNDRKTQDLRHLRRGGNLGKQLRITKVKLNNGSDILHGQQLTAEIEYETFSNLEGVSMGFGFSNLDGTRLISFDTDLVLDRCELQKDHKGKVIASLPRLDLQPGRYNVDVGARSGDNFALDYLSSCAQIEILPGPTTPAEIIREIGGVRIPVDWRWMNLDESL